MNNKPIGVFDSGVGGTSIWKEIHKLLPKESIIYLADSKNAPYGEKTKQEIVDLSIKNTEFLLHKECKIIVVACNTATTNTIHYLRENYQIPFIGIEPAIKPAALNTKTGVVGVLATRGTLTSELFSKTSDLYASGIQVVEQYGDGLVPLIEADNIDSTEMRNLLYKYLKPIIEAKADYLVLGCTHYPYLIPEIKKILPSHIAIIDSGEAVARQTKAVLEKLNLLSNNKTKSQLQFYSNTSKELLSVFLKDVEEEIEVNYLDF
ncbi:glutamate racemase [Abyssalbus ytuae]|uniref:Glutamate racemase n=1 Tax=Abyssalbus ytuae TaxID=2926907 RepID=A0A9E6ZN15_9FLAO|nr:glutamate racemase [Abyssalbus ytuae]UOB18872.1 glutamate racemase [Abyssalbus ytuae]